MKYLATFLFLCFSVGLVINAQPLQRTNPKSAEMDEVRLRQVDKIINESIENEDIPGAVLAIVRYDKLVYLQAYGYKQIEPKKEKMTTNTIFDLASLTKPTATAISTMLLVERGLLSLQDEVSYYLPDFEASTDSAGKKSLIKVIHLLTHTSGLPAYAPVDELVQKYGSPNPQGLMAHISSVKRSSSPGVVFNYSCLNFITLQAIIEKITTTDLNTFSAENIYKPLGMNNTSFTPSNALLPFIAPTEKQKNGSFLKGEVHDPLARIMNGGISGNAGLFSSAEDMAILAAMLLNHGQHRKARIMGKLTVKNMSSVPLGYEKSGRTLGWDNNSAYSSNNGDLFSKNTFGHTGYTGTSMIIDPENETAVILLTNRAHPLDKGSVKRLRTSIANIVAGSIIE